MIDLNMVWFSLVGVLFTGYAILDGFDLGVGAIHLFTKGDQERRLMLNSIGPVWDGNEVWLVTGGGALFAAFPEVYASVFSGFYLAFMLLLFALIFRAVSIEFRSRLPMQWWRRTWDTSFSVGSMVASLLMGVALGNIMLGIPLNAKHEFTGCFFSLLKPYPVLVGLTTVALFIMHGTLYALVKNQGALHDRLRGWVNKTILMFMMFYGITTIATLFYIPHSTKNLLDYPILLVIPLINVLAIVNIPRELYHGRDFRAFLSSCVTIAALMALFAISIYPNLVLSNPNPENSLNIYNAASTPKTLQIMLIIAGIGMPIVLAYTACIYWIFRGKVKLTEASY